MNVQNLSEFTKPSLKLLFLLLFLLVPKKVLALRVSSLSNFPNNAKKENDVFEMSVSYVMGSDGIHLR